MNINKALVAQRFAKAGHSYVEHALVQQQMSVQLCEYIKMYCPQRLPKVLEIGCGSGHFTQVLQQHVQLEQLFLNDLYAEVQQHFPNLKQAEIQVSWLMGDIEQLALPTQFDAVLSSAALQWMQDLPALFKRIAVALKAHGWLCFSSFGPDNLTEIKQLTGQGLSYFSAAALQQQLEQKGFEVVLLQQQQTALYFEHPKAILQHLKATGVTATTTAHRWSKQSLQQFYAEYDQFKNEHGFRLTYHPIYVIARRTA